MIAENILVQQPFLTVDEIARRLNTTTSTVNRWIRDGFLPGYKVGREWRVDPADYREFLEKSYRPKKEKSQGEV